MIIVLFVLQNTKINYEKYGMFYIKYLLSALVDCYFPSLPTKTCFHPRSHQSLLTLELSFNLKERARSIQQGGSHLAMLASNQYRVKRINLKIE